jgi:hypothetical protein
MLDILNLREFSSSSSIIYFFNEVKGKYAKNIMITKGIFFHWVLRSQLHTTEHDT